MKDLNSCFARCWYCGRVGARYGNEIEPVATDPADDHECQLVPPTPEKLEASGRGALQRIRTALLG